MPATASSVGSTSNESTLSKVAYATWEVDFVCSEEHVECSKDLFMEKKYTFMRERRTSISNDLRRGGVGGGTGGGGESNKLQGNADGPLCVYSVICT